MATKNGEIQNLIIKLSKDNDISIKKIYQVVGKMVDINAAIKPLLIKYDTTIEVIRSKTRDMPTTKKRYAVWRALSKQGFNNSEIADFFCKNPCSVWHAINCINKFK